MFLEVFPYRSPLSIVDDFKETIKNKSVCDLGCGAGDLLVRMKQVGAKDIIGLEINNRKLNLAHKNMRTFVLKKDFLNDEIPDCDVYFIWICSLLTNVYELINRIKPNKTIIICSYNGAKNYTELNFKNTNIMNLVNYKKYINHYYDETSNKESEKYGFKENGNYNIHIVTKKK